MGSLLPRVPLPEQGSVLAPSVEASTEVVLTSYVVESMDEYAYYYYTYPISPSDILSMTLIKGVADSAFTSNSCSSEIELLTWSIT